MDELNGWLDGLRSILAAMAAGDLVAATTMVAELPQVPFEKRRWRGPGGSTGREGPAAPAPVREEVLRRDHYICRYCGQRVLHPRIAPYLTAHFPLLLPYRFNMPETDTPKGPHTHFGFIRTYPEIDHVVPDGGNVLTNLVTACTPCNNYKSNRLLEDIPDMRLHDIAVSTWEGLVGLYVQAHQLGVAATPAAGSSALGPPFLRDSTRVPLRAAGQTSLTRQWNEGSFLADLVTHKKERGVQIAKEFIDWARRERLRVTWGGGRQEGSFVPRLDHKGIDYSFVAVWSYGTVEMQFEYLKDKAPFADEALRLELLRRMNRLPGVAYSADAITRRPAIALSLLEDQAVRSNFLTVLDWIVEQIKAQ